MTVQQIIDRIIRKTKVGPLAYEKTCDRIAAGDSNAEVKKIVTTFMATVEVIKEAVRIGANFIITHEPTWYTGKDDEEWCRNDPVYQAKKKLIEENGITIWRFHDHMHQAEKDGIYEGYEKETNWGKYRMEPAPGEEVFGASYIIPKTTLRELADFYKETLHMNVIQIVGDADMPVERVGVLVGGGSLGLRCEAQTMEFMRRRKLDVAVCGDITEWTLTPYVRDSNALGMPMGMLMLGHERSEEWGMKHLVSWLHDIVDGIEVVFVDTKEPFSYL